MTDTQSSNLEAARLAVTSAALAGDAGHLYNIVSGLLGDGVPFDSILFDLLIPAERDLGTRWQQGDYLVSEEHIATAAIETVISLLAGSFDQPDDALTVVVATAEGDDHSLPARALAAHLLFIGVRTLFLGANVLASDLAEFLQSEGADALVLSCAMSTHLPGARAIIASSHHAGVPVLAGGKGFGPEGQWALELGADAWVGSLPEVSQILETWSPDPAGSEESAKSPDAELLRLIDRWPGVVAMARSSIPEEAIPANQNARILTELGLTLDAVIAGVLVEDQSVIREMLGWQEATLPIHGIDAHELMVDALIEALREVSPRSADALSAARSDL